MVSSVVQINTEDGYHRSPLDVHPMDHLRRESLSPLLKPQLGHRTVHQKNTGQGISHGLMKLGSQEWSLHEEGHKDIPLLPPCEEGHSNVKVILL